MEGAPKWYLFRSVDTEVMALKYVRLTVAVPEQNAHVVN